MRIKFLFIDASLFDFVTFIVDNFAEGVGHEVAWIVEKKSSTSVVSTKNYSVSHKDNAVCNYGPKAHFVGNDDHIHSVMCQFCITASVCRRWSQGQGRCWLIKKEEAPDA